MRCRPISFKIQLLLNEFAVWLLRSDRKRIHASLVTIPDGGSCSENAHNYHKLHNVSDDGISCKPTVAKRVVSLVVEDGQEAAPRHVQVLVMGVCDNVTSTLEQR